MNQAGLTTKSSKILFSLTAWIVMILVSLLPDILFREFTGSLPTWLYWAKAGLIGALLLVSLFWINLRPLWRFFAILLMLYLIEKGVGQFFQVLNYQTWLASTSRFVQDVGSVQIQRTTASILLVLMMLALVHRFERFFLVKGKLDAVAAPIPLIMTRPTSWRILGPFIAGAMSLGLVVFIFAFGSVPSVQSLKNVLPLLPFVFLFAATNAFGEEILYRAPWLTALESPIGPVQALLITAVYFGIGHFYGVPYGVLGVIMAFIPGWLMGKAMLETRGFFWAWFIHVCMDIVVFFFIALGSVTPGG